MLPPISPRNADDAREGQHEDATHKRTTKFILITAVYTQNARQCDECR